MTTPTIHTNGTSPDRLADQYGTAKIAVLRAIEALHAASPHGRDYYPTPGAYQRAAAEHAARCAALNAVAQDLSSLEEHCYDHIPFDAR